MSTGICLTFVSRSQWRALGFATRAMSAVTSDRQRAASILEFGGPILFSPCRTRDCIPARPDPTLTRCQHRRGQSRHRIGRRRIGTRRQPHCRLETDAARHRRRQRLFRCGGTRRMGAVRRRPGSPPDRRRPPPQRHSDRLEPGQGGDGRPGSCGGVAGQRPRRVRRGTHHRAPCSTTPRPGATAVIRRRSPPVRRQR